MTYYHHTTITALRCDGYGCSVKMSIGPRKNMDDYDEPAQASGWTCWAGRTRYNFCPTCSEKYPRPKSRERMYRVY